jgi:hypothetical protein
MASGTPLSGFARFVDDTGPTYFTGPKERLNDAQKTNYRTLGYMLRGQSMNDTLQFGASIKDKIMLSVARVTHTYSPGAEESVANPQTATTWTVPWRFWLTPMTWLDQTVELNGGKGVVRETRFQQYYSEWMSIQQDGYTDWCDFMEEKYWAVPDKSKMEAQDGEEPYSIPCFVNEYTNGLPASSNQPGGTWTTVQQIDPTAVGKSNWVPQRFGYDGSTDATTGVDGLLSNLDQAYMKLDFQPPPVHREYFESPTAQPWGFIACSSVGAAYVKRVYRINNDRWENTMDPYGMPLYGGRPFVYVAQLDTAAIYPTGTGTTANTSALSTELDTTSTGGAPGPRFFVIQPKYLRSVFHSERYLSDLGVMTDPKIPTQHVKYLDTWGNTICRSRRRHAIVYPTNDAFTSYP